MLSILIYKELRALLMSPKFVVTFAVCTVLILLSVFTGIRDYQAKVRQWESGTQLASQQVREATSWRQIEQMTFRKPDPMSIFASGLTNDIGRWSEISSNSSVKLKHSSYSDDPIFAVFRFIDFTFIITVVLSLFAILFTFDSINGERERGTLKLVFSHSVSRAQFLLSKCIGSMLGLVLPITIPILLSFLMVLMMGVAVGSNFWPRVLVLVGVSMLFFTLFIVLGVLISSLTKHSSISFLFSLVIWIGFILIIPRAGVMAASQMVHVPRVAEIEGKRDGYAKDQWAIYYQGMEERWQAQRSASKSENQSEGFDSDAAAWNRMQTEDSLRREVEHTIDEYESDLMDDLRRRKINQEKLAFMLARLSPVSAYQLASMSLAGTGIELKDRYERTMTAYREEFNKFVARKTDETSDQGGFVSITVDSDAGFQLSTQRNKDKLDVSEMPIYQPTEVTFAETFSPIIPDIGILGIGVILSFLGSFIAFLRYDVR